MELHYDGDRYAGRVHLPNFIHVHDDDRLIITTGQGTRVEYLGTTSTYTYQLEAFAGAVREGHPFPTTTVDAVANMELIDSCYLAAGFRGDRTPPTLRPPRLRQSAL